MTEPKRLLRVQDSNFFKYDLDFESTRAAKQASVEMLTARFLGSGNLPAVLSGTKIGDVVYPEDHALIFGFNIFGDRHHEYPQNETEPVIVTIAPDGAVVDFGDSNPQGDSTSISKVEVRGVTEAVAQDCAWMLHGLFSKRPGYQSSLVVDGAEKVNLIVRGSRPLDEPVVAEERQSRVLMLFRVATRHSRI